MIIYTLQEAYGQMEQDQQGLALDKFLILYKGSSPLADYCTAFRMQYETAEEKAGLQINEMPKAHLFLTHAGLTQQLIDDIMLKVNGDRSNVGKSMLMSKGLASSTRHTQMKHKDTSCTISLMKRMRKKISTTSNISLATTEHGTSGIMTLRLPTTWMWQKKGPSYS